MNPQHYCREKAAPAGSSLYYAGLFHQPSQKRKIQALFALQQELVGSVRECQDPGVARIKLQWWHDEISRLYAEQARHPVTRELQALLADLKLEQSDLLHLLKAVTDEINPVQPDSLPQLIEHYADGQGRLWVLAMAGDQGMDRQVMDSTSTIAGHYYSLERLLLAAQQLNRGYCPFPLAEMHKHGLRHESLLESKNASALAALVEELLEIIQAGLAENLGRLKTKKHYPALFAIVLARIAEAQCRLLQKQSFPLPEPTSTVTPLRKLWIAWRCKRQLSGKT